MTKRKPGAKMGRPRKTEGRPIRCNSCGYEAMTESTAILWCCSRCHTPRRNPYRGKIQEKTMGEGRWN